MSEKNANAQVLKALRKETGLSQPEFAELLGVSFATVQSLELGRLALSLELASRIFNETGCGLRTVEKNGKRVPELSFTRSNSDEPYTREWFERWRAIQERLNRLHALREREARAANNLFVQQYQDAMELVLQAAAERDIDQHQSHLPKVAESFADALVSIIKKHKLGERVLEAAQRDEHYLLWASLTKDSNAPSEGDFLEQLRENLISFPDPPPPRKDPSA
jgi:transcriptional regulator with XRE-family HTH domain